jgi:hypothetical protein
MMRPYLKHVPTLATLVSPALLRCQVNFAQRQLAARATLQLHGLQALLQAIHCQTTAIVVALHHSSSSSSSSSGCSVSHATPTRNRRQAPQV